MRSGKIENKIMIMSLILGGLLNYVTGGVSCVIDGMKMAGVTILILYVLFLIGGIGAGDIKLLAVIGELFPEHVIMIIMLSFIIAGGISVIRIMVRAIKNETVLIKGETLHFSVPIVAAFILVMMVKGVI